MRQGGGTIARVGHWPDSCLLVTLKGHLCFLWSDSCGRWTYRWKFCYILVAGRACVHEPYVTVIPDITPWKKRNFSQNGHIHSPKISQTWWTYTDMIHSIWIFQKLYIYKCNVPQGSCSNKADVDNTQSVLAVFGVGKLHGTCSHVLHTVCAEYSCVDKIFGVSDISTTRCNLV